ncbi:MAG: PAS-domain containing protein [Sphingomonadales bacterium]|nr:PAS-domain containing protein [Sphingomonadales bacterium]MDE2167981.1 PAS-domain containing protein [Sphingomonadales bacterium]
MLLTPTLLALLGLLLGAWTLGAIVAILLGQAQRRGAQAAKARARRLARIIEDSPAQMMLAYPDGRIEGAARLAGWLGLEVLPGYLSDLSSVFPAAQMQMLGEAVQACQRGMRPFALTLSLANARTSLALRGYPADPDHAPGACQLWFFDNTSAEREAARMRVETAQARGDFAALSGLIEAAPMPMWFRGGDGALRLVNSAYVRAVAGASARQVVADGVELVERVEGHSPADVALQAARQGQPIERIVAATIDGQRRTLRVSDLPLGQEGVAGYAVDIEDMEELARSLRAFREAQRSLLDLLSSGVAQFDHERRLVFANQPFQRLFNLAPAETQGPLGFERWLDLAREKGRVPEARDYPAWRRERMGWFARNAAQDEAWPLSDGTHLRIAAQPMPDGGLLLIAEDRTETLRISAMRDTLLRTRTATFDSLFEAVAVFAPDGRMQIWNRRFASSWGLDSSFLDGHPHISTLLERIGARLARPPEARAVGDCVRAATLERRETGARVALADGRVVEYAGVPLPDGNGLLIVLDITDSQKAEEALRERNAALVEADQLKTRFLANMSYEFRTPLTSIGGFAEMLQMGLGGELSEGGREYVEAILTSVARLSDQIENVLDLSQSEAGMLPLAREEIEVLSFVTALVKDRETRIHDSNITLDLRGSAAAGRIHADPRRLGRALGHLIDNAIAAAPRGGHIRIDLARHRMRGADWLRISIQDDGPGMDGPSLARALGGIRMGPDGAMVERRQGLGLPLARQLIEAHGGTLDLASQPGKGTLAVVELP